MASNSALIDEHTGDIAAGPAAAEGALIRDIRGEIAEIGPGDMMPDFEDTRDNRKS